MIGGIQVQIMNLQLMLYSLNSLSHPTIRLSNTVSWLRSICGTVGVVPPECHESHNITVTLLELQISTTNTL